MSAPTSSDGRIVDLGQHHPQQRLFLGHDGRMIGRVRKIGQIGACLIPEGAIPWKSPLVLHDKDA
jgi:hypothetical protein